MNIVCGDALGVSCGTWIAFWNGAIGALVAAILGGTVALLVVRLTNAQQRRGVAKTIEIAALADFISHIEELEWELGASIDEERDFENKKSTLALRAAAVRLQMSSKEAEPIADILRLWPYKLDKLVLLHQLAKVMGKPYGEQIYDVIASASTTASAWLPGCTEPREIHKCLRKLREEDELMDSSITRFRGLLYRSRDEDAGSVPSQ